MADKTLNAPRSRNPFAADMSAGLVVFLVALPLCLGIANASGTSPLSGIIAGVVGGIVIGLVSGSPLSVSGPAAGLVAIIVTALVTLAGSFQALQCAIVLAGAIQIVLGIFKLGNIANFIPNSVIKGMLAGIGAVIILKQVPHALGWDKDYESELGFFSRFGNTFSDIYKAVVTFTPSAVAIFGVAIAIILFWDSKKMKSTKIAKAVPGALVAVVAGGLINEILKWVQGDFALKSTDGHLVVLPLGDKLVTSFTLPDWSVITAGPVWVIALTIAAVASIETLLCIEAADKLDEKRRVTPPNRELIAQGIGNAVSGFIGGLPITSCGVPRMLTPERKRRCLR